ncbi:hypothetical protein [Ferrovibrio sp.]|uniref:hypothetical protein n=1 Tax=Ferrovibrio sp. TaxID=1917215 RepID=UPI0035B4A3AF
MGKKQYIQELIAYGLGDPTHKDLKSLRSEIYNGSDRSCAIVFGSFVEISLIRFLKTKTRPSTHEDIFDYRGPLGTFSSKIRMAYSLNFIGPKTHSDLDKIRHLRNTFAHSRLPLKFKTPVVKRVCDLLYYPDIEDVYVPFDFLDKVGRNRLKAATDKTNPRTRFIITCYEMSGRMLEARGEGLSTTGANFP